MPVPERPAAPAGLATRARGSSSHVPPASVAPPPAPPGAALVDAKVRLHGRIIDEFNLALIDKLSPEDLGKQVVRYVADYAARERLTLNSGNSKPSASRSSTR